MKRNSQEVMISTRAITRRSLVLGGGMLGFGALLVGRMNHLQVDQADEFRLLAEENRIKVRLLAPARGVIYDRNGVVLAGNEQIYRVSMIREDADDVDQVITRLRGLVRLNEDTLQRALREMDRDRYFATLVRDRDRRRLRSPARSCPPARPRRTGRSRRRASPECARAFRAPPR